ncbi:hypothetical protein BA81_12565 [Bacillus safensis FO-36b]|uniref:hypothetical protein n=1 Tax=Bacillus TaxID=1386 RepID=UPI00045D0ADC|nr:hypothetical protein [Bacillus safensis]AWI37929.1 hypothetical protein RS87_14480 [Bacillus safensis FO-36b]KDE26850.1 hypothetical protein BA81_12565 [Bacillus safensis FO-36b]MBT2261740.1 hypothetical protein [Bacillus safensis]MCM3047926.1 type III secretion protein [Bacillus safensis]MCY7544564.1 type III secretion protein [Bacillus safensis]
MNWIYKYDEKFNYLPGEEIEIEGDADIPKGYTTVRPQDGLYKGKYNEAKREWYESATQEYIDSLQPKPLPQSEIDLLKQQNADLLQQLAEAEQRVEEQSKIISELIMLLNEKGVI